MNTVGWVERSETQLCSSNLLGFAALYPTYKLVANPEKETKALIDFLGLEWEEECLDFHKTKRSVQTSSDWQVRQPIYQQSVARWKKYEPYLRELVEGLENERRLI